jgi:fatty acid desaturase
MEPRTRRKAMQVKWLTYEFCIGTFWVAAVVAVVCLISAAVGLIGWGWFFFAVVAIVWSLSAIRRAHQRTIYDAGAARVMDRVQTRLQSSHPNGGVTFDEYVEALRAEGVSDAERFAAEYPRPEKKPG